MRPQAHLPRRQEKLHRENRMERQQRRPRKMMNRCLVSP